MALLAKWKAEGLLNDSAFEKLGLFADLLLQWNSRINLTGLTSRESVEEILICESILAARAFPLSEKRVLDIGSGAGIPGLVWLTCDPTIHLTSLEIRAKKVAFQKEACRRLDLKAEIISGRFPYAVRERKFDVIATRAVRFDQTLWTQASPLLEPGGSFLRFGASSLEEQDWHSLPISTRTNLIIRRVES